MVEGAVRGTERPGRGEGEAQRGRGTERPRCGVAEAHRRVDAAREKIAQVEAGPRIVLRDDQVTERTRSTRTRQTTFERSRSTHPPQLGDQLAPRTRPRHKSELETPRRTAPAGPRPPGACPLPSTPVKALFNCASRDRTQVSDEEPGTAGTEDTSTPQV